MPPIIPGLRLLCSYPPSPRSKHLFRFYFFSSLIFNPRAYPSSHLSTVAALSYSCRRESEAFIWRFQNRKGNFRPTELIKEKDLSSLLDMDEVGMPGFNKRRAEGRDNSNRPRTLQLKNRKLNPINTICYVQILGTGMDTQDTTPAVLLFFDKQRFIFNAGEGLQRFCTEHKIKLSKIDHIFLTRVSSETAGGLPGLLLTLAGIGDEGISANIWGPSDLKYLLAAMRSFIPSSAMVHTHSFGEPKSSHEAAFLDPIVLLDDEVLCLSAILLRPKLAGGSMKPGDIAVVYACELPEIKGKFNTEIATTLGLKPGPKYRELQLGNSVMSDHLDIMVHSQDVLGPSIPGPIFLLVDCPTPSHMEALFSAHSLNLYYVSSRNCEKEGIKSVNCVIHLAPSSVTKNTEYQLWMKRFGNAQHIMAGHEMNNMKIPIFKSSTRLSARLNYICPQLFPASRVWSHMHEVSSDSFRDSAARCEAHFEDVTNIVSAENLLKFHLRPYSQLGLDRRAIPSLLNQTEIFKELLSELPEDVSEHLSSFWRNHAENLKVGDGLKEPWIFKTPCLLSPEYDDAIDMPACLDNISRVDMEIILLGTGSAQPSKYRNVSSIFINLFSKGSLLLDCGEGTLAQLKIRFGVEGADIAVKKLKCIWISHIHADHHIGLVRILAHRCQLLKDFPHEPLVVIGPRQLKLFLDAYSQLEDLDMLFLNCRHTFEGFMDAALSSQNFCRDGSTDVEEKENGEKESVPRPLESTLFSHGSKIKSYWKRPVSPFDMVAVLPVLKRLTDLLHEAGLDALYSVPVVHCLEAFAIVLIASERTNAAGKVIPGWKLVYSGDTRPCQSLIDAARGATVLIHEATFEDGLGEEAVAKKHSTTMEAIQVGSTARAYRIILTHFSQRYPKIPVFDEADMHKTCIAFDLMSVNLADLPFLPKIVPLLKLLFRNETIVEETDDDAKDMAVSQY